MSFLSPYSTPLRTTESFWYRRLRVTVLRRGLQLEKLRVDLTTVPYPNHRASPGTSCSALVAAQLSRGITFPLELLQSDSFSQFERDVYLTLTRLKAGERVTYGQLADRSGHPGASRAVGQCLRENPVPLLIPCHRVVRSDGTPGGYQGNARSDLKAYLLDLEQRLKRHTDF